MLNRLINNSSEYLKRFRLSIFFSIVFFLFSVFVNHIDRDDSNEWTIRFLGVIGYSFFFSIGLKLIMESFKKSLTVYYIFSLLALLLVYFHFFPFIHDNTSNFMEMKSLSDTNPNFLFFFPLASLFFIFTAPFFKKESTNDELSTFNQNTWLQMFFSILGSIILWIGGAIILFSMDSLLRIKIESKVYLDLFLFSFTLFFPVFFLSGIPKNFNEVKEQYSNSMKYILTYICIPILTIFSFIFIIYILKIIFINGFKLSIDFFRVFYFYSFVGILTYIMSYPFRNESKVMNFFYKNFFKLLIFPTILSIMMIFPYVNKYGFTAPRYLGLVFLIWIITSIIIKFLSKRNDIKNISIVTVSMLFILSLSPLNLENAPEKSQIYILKNILKKNDLLIDGRFKKSDMQLKVNDEKRIKDISDYLISSHRRKLLQELLDDKINITDEIDKNTSWEEREKIKEKIFNILTSKE